MTAVTVAYDVDDSDATWLFGRDALATAYGPLAPHSAHYVRDINGFVARTCNAVHLPLLLCATSTLYTLRVFTKRPLNDPHRHAVATACILLAAEVDEYPHVSNETIVDAAWRRCAESFPSLAGELSAFTRLVRSLVYPVFAQLGWQGRTKHPYAYLPLVVDDMRDFKTRHAVLREAWLLISECYLTDTLLLFRPSVVACAAVALAAERLGSSPSPSTFARWTGHFDCSPALLADARDALRPLCLVS